MSKHHPYGPSNYPAWATGCMKFHSGGKKSNEAAVGSDVHEQVSKWIKTGEEPDSSVARWMCDKLEELSNNNEIYSEVRVGDDGLACNHEVLEGVFGTVDAWFYDDNGEMHIVDFKTFSDGSTDYSAQLKGYAALMRAKPDEVIHLHIFHGGIFKVEDVDCSHDECVKDTVALLNSIKNLDSEPTICKWCQYCEHIKECKAVNNAVATVNDNAVQFGNMSLPQKLVVCEAIEKLIKTLKEDAKAQAIANDGVLEADGIRYEIKEKAGKGKVHDLTEVATAMGNVLVFNKKNEPTKINGLDNEELLKICELPKTAFVAAMKEKNKDITSVPKKNIEQFCAAFYDKGEPVKSLVRVK